MRFYDYLKTVFFGFFMLINLSVAEPVTINQAENTIFLAEHLSVFIDKEGQTSVHDISSMDESDWTAPINKFSGIPNYGYVAGAIWLRIEIANQLELEDWLIDVADPLIDELSFYVYQNGKMIDDYVTGDSKIFYLRRIPHRHFLYPLQLEQGEAVTVYLKIKSSSPVLLDVNLWSTDEFFYEDQYSLLGQSFYFGAMMVMAAFNLMIYLFIRDNTYLLYVAFVAAQAMFHLALHGYGYQILWSFSPWFQQYAIIFFLNISIASALLFWNQFLALYKFFPRSSEIINYFAYALLGILFFTLFVPYRFIIIPSIVLCIVSLCLVLIISFPPALKRAKGAFFILFSWVAFIIGGFVFSLSRLGYLPYNQYTDLSFQLSMLIEVIILSVAIADNINTVRREKIIAQQEALVLQQEYNERLEQSVNVRTKALEEANKKLSLLSETDALTGVKNRRSFDELFRLQYEDCIRLKQPMAIIMVDIDHFKLINDRYGHLVGDECLRLLGKTLQQYIYRETDTVTRYGGEEFAITLPATSLEAAKAKAEELCEAIRQIELVVEDSQIPITASLGVASHLPVDKGGAGQLINQADEALYQAKNKGRDQVCVKA